MKSWLVNISKKIWDNHYYQHLLFLIATIITISFLGYYFGTFDQVIHIPFLKKFADPTLFPNDQFFELRNYHYSFFWFLFIPAYKLGVLEISMFITHFIITYLTFYSLWRLSKTLFNNPLTSLITIIIFIFPHLGFGGFPIFEFSLLNRTFVLPFLLLAINYYFEKKYIAGFLLLGLMSNLHILSVIFVLALLSFDMIIRYRQIGIKKIILSIFGFIFFSLPVLIWKFSNSSIDPTFNYQWFMILKHSILGHLFTVISSNFNIIFLNINALFIIFLFFYLKKFTKSVFLPIINHFVFGAIIVLIIHVISCQILPSTIIVQMQIVRVGLYILIFTYLLLANYIAQSINSKHFRVMALTGLLSIVPLINISLLFRHFLNSKTKIILYYFIILAVFFIGLLFGYKLKLWQPGIYIYPKKDNFFHAQQWAKNNTNTNDVFITPPHIWWLYDTDWRVISERSTVSTLSELLEAAFYPSYYSYWYDRFNQLAPNSIKYFNDDFFNNFQVTKDAYYNLTSKDFINISYKYQAKYLVVEAPASYHFPVVYSNPEFTIYLIKDD